MEMLRLIVFVFCWSCAFFLQSCLAEEFRINGNISVVLQNLEVNLFVLKGDEITRHVNYMPPNSPILRPPCRTCDPTYNLFHINKQYLVPNHSKIYVVNPNSMTQPYKIDIRNCNPIQLYSVKQNTVWVQCAFKDGLFEVVELRTREDNVTWYRHGSQNIVFSNNVSRNGLVLVKEKDGENVTFLYYGNGRILQRKGLEELSLARYSTLCEIIEELFYINDKLILIQCILKNAPTEHGLVLFNTSNPSQSFSLLHRFDNNLIKVHVFEDYMVLLSQDTLIVQNALRFTRIQQLIVFPPELSINGIFVRLKDIIYFVCTSRKEIYFIDIASVLGGNVTAYHRVESREEICTDMTCSLIQYIEPLLFVPLKTNELAMYTLDPVKLYATADILTSHYRYFFTYTHTEIPLESIVDSNNTIPFVDNNTIVLEVPSQQSKSNGRTTGVVAGVTVTFFVIILCVIIVIGTWYWYHKKRSSRYYQYQTSEVRFERADNNQDEGIVIVSGRFDNPIWPLNDSDTSGEEQSNLVSIPTPGLNNQSATNAKKKKDTNTTGGYKAPSNVDNYADGDNGSEMSYGFETREEPVDRRQYMDSLVIGTFNNNTII